MLRGAICLATGAPTELPTAPRGPRWRFKAAQIIFYIKFGCHPKPPRMPGAPKTKPRGPPNTRNRICKYQALTFQRSNSRCGELAVSEGRRVRRGGQSRHREVNARRSTRADARVHDHTCPTRVGGGADGGQWAHDHMCLRVWGVSAVDAAAPTRPQEHRKSPPEAPGAPHMRPREPQHISSII